MKFKNPLLLIFLSWLVSALAILGVAFAILPDTYVDGFWCRIAWTEILNMLFWVGSYGWFIENKNNTDMAITPAISFLTSVYCVLSFIFMLAFYKDESVNGFNKWHETIQIVLCAFYVLLIIRIKLAGHFADKDLVLSKDAYVSPLDLAQKIKCFEQDSQKELAKELKKLREKITYSLQNNNRIRTNEQYKKFAKELIGKINNRHISVKDVQNYIVEIENLIYATKRD